MDERTTAIGHQLPMKTHQRSILFQFRAWDRHRAQGRLLASQILIQAIE
jgi:hypothetical protein